MSDVTRLDFGEAEFQARPELNGHLAWESFVALAKHPNRVQLIDHALRRREMKSGLLLALAWMLSRRLLSWTDRPRVGIVFPPGIGGTIANLAVVLAGKVPVNLNFTLGLAGSAACLRKAEIDCLLSTETVRIKLTDFAWPQTGVIDLVEVLKTLSKAKTMALLAVIQVMPAKCLAKLLKVPRVGGAVEAGLLFTSGSAGEPKGVVLSHRNILGNCLQIDSTQLLTNREKVIANLPIFHSFGFTVTLWYPLLRGCTMVTIPSPLEFKKTARVIEVESATILIGTPTFLKPYIRHVAPECLKSLKYVMTGAEKMPEGLADLWQARFNCLYFEGYGLTETSPVVSINLPCTATGIDYRQSVGTACKPGSVGRPLPGHAARIVDPDTMEPLPVTEVGLLLLKGPNIFSAYLKAPERTAEVMQDEWFITGDLARFDDAGYLFIEGRQSRFSKIAGEMVPHGTIEQALLKAFGLIDAERPMLAISARADAAKGEALVLLAAMEVELTDVRKTLSAAGYSNLWVPKQIKRVESIPTLLTGKLDLRAIKALAETD